MPIIPVIRDYGFVRGYESIPLRWLRSDGEDYYMGELTMTRANDVWAVSCQDEAIGFLSIERVGSGVWIYAHPEDRLAYDRMICLRERTPRFPY